MAAPDETAPHPNAPELVHVATMTAEVGISNSLVPNGPKGSRVIAEVGEVVLTGERVNARSVGHTAADWLTMAPDRSYGILDVRITLSTDDGVIIFCEYGGRIDIAAGRAISAPTFQVGDERYDWMNRIQCIGIGTSDRTTNLLTYELYEVRAG